MKGLFAAALLLAGLFICLAEVRDPLDQQDFATWTQLVERTYHTPDEAALRQKIFEGNVKTINANNAGPSLFKLAINEFTDLTAEEFRQTKLGLRPQNGTFRAAPTTAFTHGTVVAPPQVDWVKKGVVTEVKNQLFCGSCWAFSTTGSIEGINALYTGKLVSLSEQELVDCDTSKDQGCSGGLMDYAFDFVMKNGGIDTEKDYAYWSVGGICNKLREDRHVVIIDGFEDVPVNDEKALQKAVAVQPVSVAICADPLQFYSSGIVDNCCTELDHGVLVVGYGEEEGVPYWLVKNSWGSTWGDAGYFKLKRDVGKEGMCGIAMAASYPLKSSPNPSPDTVPEVCGFFGQTECKHGSECTCTMNVLDLLCLQWGCKERDAKPTAYIA